MSALKCYPKPSVALHWVSAILILAIWPIGKFLMDDDSIGFRRPGLYVALLLLSFTGIGMLIAAGSVPVPGSTYKPDLYGETGPADLHEGPANILMILFVMHIAGVVFYQLTKGRTLRRMSVPVGPDLTAAER